MNTDEMLEQLLALRSQIDQMIARLGAPRSGRWMTTPEAGRYIGCSDAKVRRMAKDGELKMRQTDGGTVRAGRIEVWIEK